MTSAWGGRQRTDLVCKGGRGGNRPWLGLPTVQSLTDAPLASNPEENVWWYHQHTPLCSSVEKFDVGWYLDTLVQQMHDVAACHQSLNVTVQSLTLRYKSLTNSVVQCVMKPQILMSLNKLHLRQSGKKIKGNNHEVLVWQLKLVCVLDVGNVLVKRLLHEGDTPLVHRLTVRQETLLQRCRHAGANIREALERISHLERHSRRGKRSLSSSLSTFHFCMSGGMRRLMYSGLFKWCPTLSARVPIASYLNTVVTPGKPGGGCNLQDQQVFMLIFVESEDQGLENEAKVRNELGAGLLLQGGECAAGGLLHPLVAVQDPLQQLRHQRLQILLVRLLANPVCISRQGPAGDTPHQSLLVTQAVDKVGYKLTEVGHHSGHASLCDCSQRQDAGLLHLPFRMEESLLQDWEQDRQELN